MNSYCCSDVLKNTQGDLCFTDEKSEDHRCPRSRSQSWIQTSEFLTPSNAPSGHPGVAQIPRPDSPVGCLEEVEGLVREGPELLDFSVDDVAEQLTLMDAVRIPAGRGREGAGRRGGRRGRGPAEHRSYPPPTPARRSSSRACGPSSAWAPCGRSGTGRGPQAPPPLCAPL